MEKNYDFADSKDNQDLSLDDNASKQAKDNSGGSKVDDLLNESLDSALEENGNHTAESKDEELSDLAKGLTSQPQEEHLSSVDHKEDQSSLGSDEHHGHLLTHDSLDENEKKWDEDYD